MKLSMQSKLTAREKNWNILFITGTALLKLTIVNTDADLHLMKEMPGVSVVTAWTG